MLICNSMVACLRVGSTHLGLAFCFPACMSGHQKVERLSGGNRVIDHFQCNSSVFRYIYGGTGFAARANTVSLLALLSEATCSFQLYAPPR